MQIQDVISRAISDEAYARELSEKALAATRVPVTEENLRGEEWSSLLGEFAANPDELGRLTASFDAKMVEEGSPWWTTTVTSTTLTTTTAVCTTTTTTSVTTVTTATIVQ